MADLKAAAAEKALGFLSDDVRVLGLGTGSTAGKFIHLLAERMEKGEFGKIVAVATSIRTKQLADSLNIPTKSLDEVPEIDLTVDGADEVDPACNLIKGHGGALTCEKIVAGCSRQFIVIVDESKCVERLGSRVALPVEVLRFGWSHTLRRLEDLGCTAALRSGEKEPFLTDQKNYIVDCAFNSGIPNPGELNRALNQMTGVVEHGLFLGMAHRVLVASSRGVEVLERDKT